MAALVRLGTLQVRISSHVAACSAIQHSAAQNLWHGSCPNTKKSLCTFTTELKDEHKGLLHTAAGKQIWKTMLHTTQRNSTTKDELRPTEEEVGTLTKIIEAMGFTGPLKYNKWKIKIAALRMYTCCVERIDYDEFFEKCNLPDTLNSWFLVTQLHVWMSMVRMKQEGRAGKYMCRFIVYSMWEDVEQRGKVMGIDPVTMKNTMKALTEIFYASIFGYDEGIISDDRILAAALWRNLFNLKCDDPRHLELMVEYVRKQIEDVTLVNPPRSKSWQVGHQIFSYLQEEYESFFLKMQYLDSLNGEDLLLTGEVAWRPLVESDPQSILKTTPPTYNDEGL